MGRRGRVLRSVGACEWPDGTCTTRYEFRHALYQQVAVCDSGIAQRVMLHRRMGAWLERVCDRVAALAPELAMHFDQGRDFARAVSYLHQAAETALQRHAPQEAQRALRRALELLPQLPDTPGRTQQELTLYLALGPALMATRGQAHPEVRQVYAHAHVLCQHVGDITERFSALHGLWLWLLVQGRFPTAQDVAAQCFRLAQQHPAPSSLLVAHRAMGSTLFYRGELLRAQPHLQQGKALSAAPDVCPPGGHYFFHPGVLCAMFRVLSLWLLGYPTQARQQLQETLTLAQALAHPATLVLVLNYAAKCQRLYRDEPATQTLNQAALQVATAQEFALWLAEGEAIRGWARVAHGAGEAGCAQVHQSVATMRSAGGMLWQPYHLTVLGELYGSIGQTDRGLVLLTEALEVMQTNGERWYEAEAQRLMGALLLQQPTAAVQQAETCFQQALALARQQGAKAWELRGAMSLAACGSSRASRPKPARCWPRSMAGSPRGSTPPTSRRRKRCWRTRGLTRAGTILRCHRGPTSVAAGCHSAWRPTPTRSTCVARPWRRGLAWRHALWYTVSVA